MAFSAGASNVANAVASLAGSWQLEMTPGVAIGGVAIGIGAFAIGPRAMETVGGDITDLSLEPSLIAESIAASIRTGLIVFVVTVYRWFAGTGRRTRGNDSQQTL